MKKVWKDLMTEIEHTGELQPMGRESIRKHLEKKSVCGTNLHRELEQKCLKKVESSWGDHTPVSVGLLEGARELFGKIFENLAITEREVENFKTQCMREAENGAFYASYLSQAVWYFVWDAGCEEEEWEDETITNGDLEFEELDTVYCACMMWKYQEADAEECYRKKRELEFWEWYVKEAAHLQGENIYDYVLRPKISLAKRVVNTVEDFVKAISYEFDYIKYEKTDDKRLIIHVDVRKDGCECPKCGVFSSHVYRSAECVDKPWKIDSWAVELRCHIYLWYCDNPECPETWFPTQNRVWYNEIKANFLSVVRTDKEKVCELFEL